jgi:archaeal flagellin FlaB
LRWWILNKKAEMGIGTLIIFIALLLVAAVAAGVLIQTTGSLQEKALTTGTQSRSQISTNAQVIEVSATNGSAGSIINFTSIMKLAPGSDEIKLEEALITFNTYDSTVTFTYGGIEGTDNFTADTSSGVGNFSVEYLQIGPNFREGNLQRGDVIKVYYAAPGPVGEGQQIRLNFIPKVGTPTLTEFVTPEVISTERVYLYP